VTKQPEPTPASAVTYESWTAEELHKEASARDLHGRSGMDKAALAKALAKDDADTAAEKGKAKDKAKVAPDADLPEWRVAIRHAAGLEHKELVVKAADRAAAWAAYRAELQRLLTIEGKLPALAAFDAWVETQNKAAATATNPVTLASIPPQVSITPEKKG
jgi:hypothetical protein